MYYPLELFLDIDMTYIIQTFSAISQNVFIFLCNSLQTKNVNAAWLCNR